MDNNQKNSSGAERRNLSLTHQMLWDNLNPAQKVAASSLFHFGFRLNFIRESTTDAIVGLLLDGKPATINRDGVIDISPDISMRG